MNTHDIAIGIIDSRFEALNKGNSSASLHSETTMAIEMAYALSAINMDEHRSYVGRLQRIYELQAEMHTSSQRRAS